MTHGRTARSALDSDAGIHVRPCARGYLPDASLPETEAKLLKPQNVVEMLAAGSRDAGFAGADWVAELQADVVELLDTELDQVQIVAADFVRSYGATEVFPPEDADVIVDNTATGATLEANGLRVIDVLMQSSTRLYT